MLEAIAFHLLAGTVAGSVFRIRTLSLMLCFVLVEAVLLGVAQGTTALLWAAAALSAVQIGYLAGSFGRGALESAGYAPSRIGKRPTH